MNNFIKGVSSDVHKFFFSSLFVYVCVLSPLTLYCAGIVAFICFAIVKNIKINKYNNVSFEKYKNRKIQNIDEYFSITHMLSRYCLQYEKLLLFSNTAH